MSKTLDWFCVAVALSILIVSVGPLVYYADRQNMNEVGRVVVDDAIEYNGKEIAKNHGIKNTGGYEVVNLPNDKAELIFYSCRVHPALLAVVFLGGIGGVIFILWLYQRVSVSRGWL